MIQICLYTYCD